MRLDAVQEASKKINVSIHAPTWGATQTDAAVGVEHVFQSTHPHGVRQFNGAAPAVPIIVSIHAPTWGATAVRTQIKGRLSVSIHAPTWGATVTHRR